MGKRTYVAVRSLLAVRTAAAIALGIWMLGTEVSPVHSQTPQTTRQGSQNKDQLAREANPPRGVQINKPNAFQGYTLVFPLQSTATYLIDMQGKVVRTWQSRYSPGQEAYLLENGHLLRAAKLSDAEALFAGPAQGGRVQEFTWDGKLVWDFKFHNERQIQHHAITPMPNGNVLLIVWERKTPKEAIEAGVKPEQAGDTDILVDSIIEVKPKGLYGGEVVWEWHLWDHLIQDHDRSKANFGDVAAHPELVDVNYHFSPRTSFANLARFANPPAKKDEPKKGNAKNDAVEKLKGIGYIGASGGKKFAGFFPDWTHVNGVSYNAKLDQIMLSPREFSEVWIIDHSTTRAEAAGHKGGRSGKGGDLLYRWGNPQTYRAGTAADQLLFHQHDTHWIPEGLPGEGHLLVFNNGGGSPDRSGGGGPNRNYSSVDEVVLPLRADGSYERKPGAAYGPEKPIWSYTAAEKSEFFAPAMSGAQRLPNGNTLVCTGFSGTIFEVTPEKEIVWDYINPAKDTKPLWRGGGPIAGPPGRGGPNPFAPSSQSVQILPVFVQFSLQLSDEQRKSVADFEKEASAKLEAMLSEEQRKQLKELQKNTGPFGPGSPGGPGGPPEIGRIMPGSIQDKLKLTTDQKDKLAGLQKEADRKLDEVLNEDQKKQLKGMAEMMKTFARRRPGGRPGGPPGTGRGGFFGSGGGSAIFRAYRYGPNYPGLIGKDLTPTKTIEELESQQPPKKN